MEKSRGGKPVKVRDAYCPAEKLKRSPSATSLLLGMEPDQDTIDLEKGIALTIEWVDSNLDTLKNLPHGYIHKS